MTRASVRQRLLALLAPVVTGCGHHLEDVQVQPVGRRRLVRLVVDHDGGVDLNGVAGVSRAVSRALDGAGVLGDAPYVLEVSSPGVDRPLTLPRHWRGAVGRRVRATLTAGGTFTGRVTDAGDDTVVLAAGGDHRRFGYPELRRGQVLVEFGGEEVC